MPQAVPIVLGCWVPLTLLLFWKLPPRQAVIVCLLGGWLFLPTARYPDDVAAVEFPYWVMPASLPAPPWITKAPVIAVAALLGVLIFDAKAFRRFRPAWIDLAMLGWIVWPIVSSLANHLGLIPTLLVVSYQCLSWGVPYVLGRLYFSDREGRSELARGLIVGGLVYTPFCLVESVIGPWLYADLYGFHPYRAQGAVRYVGYRPVVFLEDGNQLGIWLATSALSAAVLWRSGQLRRFWGVPGAFVAGGLVALSILSQSAGAVLLLVAALIAIEVLRWSNRIWPLMVPLALIAVILGLRALNLIDAKALAQKTAVGRAVVTTLYRTDRQSFGWRLRVEERQAKLALQRPLTGWGRWDWWRSGEERPWGLPGLTLGMYGLSGWALLMACLAAPVLLFLMQGRPRTWDAAALALAAVLIINGLDAILNSAYFLPLTAAAGGLVTLSPSSRPDSSQGHRVVKIRR